LLGDQPIPLKQTSVFVSAGDVLSTFTSPVRHGFQAIVVQLSVALGHRGQRGLRAAVANAPALMHETALVAPAMRGVDLQRSDRLERLLPSLSGTVDALAGQGDQLSQIAHHAASTLAAVTAQDAVPLGASIDALPGALAGVQAAGERASAVSADARAAAGDLIPALRAIPRVTPPVTSLLRQAAPVLSGAALPVDDFATALGELGHNGPALARLLGTLDGISGELRYGVVPALDARSKLGMPTYVQLLAAVTGFTG